MAPRPTFLESGESPRPPASLPLQPKSKAKACACAMQTGVTDKLSLRPILVFPFPPKIQVVLKVL